MESVFKLKLTVNQEICVCMCSTHSVLCTPYFKKISAVSISLS